MKLFNIQEVSFAILPDPIVTIEQILKEVSRFHRIPVEIIKHGGRNRRITLPRHEVFWLARMLTKNSYPRIGKFTGGFDHHTVIHGVRKMDGHIERREIGSDDLIVLLQYFAPKVTWH